jgi:hypothetical protein
MPYDEHPEDDELRKIVEYMQALILQGKFGEIPTAILQSQLAKYEDSLKRGQTIHVRDSVVSRRYRILSREEFEKIVQRIRDEVERRDDKQK